MLAVTARQVTNKNKKTAPKALVDIFDSIKYRSEHGDDRTHIDKHYSGMDEQEFDKLLELLRALGYKVEPDVNKDGEVSTERFTISW